MGIYQRSCCTATKLLTGGNDGKSRNPSRECIFWWAYTNFFKPRYKNTNEQSVEEELNEGENDVEESEDEIPEYESEATSGEENDERHMDSMKNVATFLIGTSSRFGRGIKLNKKYIA